MYSRTSFSPRRRFFHKTCAAFLSASLGITCLHAKVPKNLAFGLQELATDYQAAKPDGATKLTHKQFQKVMENYINAMTDDEDRVMVDVYLDGSKPIGDVITACEALGCTITARVDWYRNGALSMYLPPAKASKLGRTGGVDSARLSAKPRHHVGKVTSGGTQVLKSTLVNAEGYYGAGITVGAMSDSFDTSKAITSSPPLTTAAVDEADDDLPGPGSAYNTNPVYVLLDYGTSSTSHAGTDEGRAMCQIVHDVAPAANISFATGDVSEVGFAQNIVALATPTTTNVTIPASKYTTPAPVSPATTVTRAGGGCQVICDDLGYGDEPFFSDGILSQAVDNVTRNYGVTYFSSAGNDGNSGYAATYNPQTNNAANEALLLTEGGITYASIGTATETAAIESFHSFGTNAAGQPILVQKVLVPTLNGSNYPGYISFQWNDPDALTVGGVKQVSTDYDILVFSVNTTTGAATYQSRLSVAPASTSPPTSPRRTRPPG